MLRDSTHRASGGMQHALAALRRARPAFVRNHAGQLLERDGAFIYEDAVLAAALRYTPAAMLAIATGSVLVPQEQVAYQTAALRSAAIRVAWPGYKRRVEKPRVHFSRQRASPTRGRLPTI